MLHQLIILRSRGLWASSIILLGISFQPAIAETPENVAAGLLLHLGDQLATDRLKFLEDYQECSSDTQNIAIILFTRDPQSYSLKMRAELKILLEKDRDNRIFIWEFSLKQDSQVEHITEPESPPWILKEPTSRTVFSQFGIKVFPSLFILNSHFVITDYLAGLPDNTRPLLSALVEPTHSDNKHLMSHEMEQKRQNRREHFAFELYNTGNFTGALKQLEYITSISDTAMLLKIYTLIQLKQFATAQDLLETVFHESYEPDTLLYIQSLIFYYQDQFGRALDELLNAQSPDQSYKILYLHSCLLNKIGKAEQAKTKYSKAKLLAGRDLRNSDLTDFRGE